MDKNSKVYVAGHQGLVGSALVRRLLAGGHSPQSLVLKTHQELDLTDQAAVRDFFAAEKPEYVFLAAAKVGGIHANNTYPAEFIQQNLAIQTNVIHEAWRNNVRRLLFLGSSCIYPRDCPQPIREEYLLTGPLEPTNSAYALAKIAGIEMCRAYNQQYGAQFLTVMPTNLYGPEDLDDAAYAGQIGAWRYPLVNIGCGADQTITELAMTIAGAIGFRGELRYDATKPDGTPQKLLDISRIGALGWRPRIGLREGIARTYRALLAARTLAPSRPT